MPPRKRCKYDWQPATTCKSVSGAIQYEHSDVVDIPHLARFWRVGRELLMYCTVKLKIFFGEFDCDTDHTFVNWERAYFVTLLKKEPWQLSWLLSLFSCPERKSLRTCLVER